MVPETGAIALNAFVDIACSYTSKNIADPWWCMHLHFGQRRPTTPGRAPYLPPRRHTTGTWVLDLFAPFLNSPQGSNRHVRVCTRVYSYVLGRNGHIIVHSSTYYYVLVCSGMYLCMQCTRAKWYLTLLLSVKYKNSETDNCSTYCNVYQIHNLAACLTLFSEMVNSST